MVNNHQFNGFSVGCDKGEAYEVSGYRYFLMSLPYGKTSINFKLILGANRVDHQFNVWLQGQHIIQNLIIRGGNFSTLDCGTEQANKLCFMIPGGHEYGEANGDSVPEHLRGVLVVEAVPELKGYTALEPSPYRKNYNLETEKVAFFSGGATLDSMESYSPNRSQFDAKAYGGGVAGLSPELSDQQFKPVKFKPDESKAQIVSIKMEYRPQGGLVIPPPLSWHVAN